MKVDLSLEQDQSKQDSFFSFFSLKSQISLPNIFGSRVTAALKTNYFNDEILISGNFSLACQVLKFKNKLWLIICKCFIMGQVTLLSFVFYTYS
jgi:hypothetical protein